MKLDFAMGDGTLYVARLGTPPPDSAVRLGMFSEPWAPAWERVGDGSLVLGQDFLANEVWVEITPDPPRRNRYSSLWQWPSWQWPSWATGSRSLHNPPSLAEPRVMLGWHSISGAQRLFCDQARLVGPGWRFALEIPPGGGNPYRLEQVGTGRSVSWSTPSPTIAPFGGQAAELVPGRLRGFRQFKVLPAEPLEPVRYAVSEQRPPRLASITASEVWPWTPSIEARCLRAQIIKAGMASFTHLPAHDPADVPAGWCSCGIYARHVPAMGSYVVPRVAGVIEAWGRVEVGRDGFRARYARLVALCLDVDDVLDAEVAARNGVNGVTTETLDQLGQLYRVPVFHGRREMLDRFPPIDVSGLLGPPASPTSVTCRHCGAILRDQAVANAHLRQCPAAPVPLPVARCSVCGYLSSDQRELLAHVVSCLAKSPAAAPDRWARQVRADHVHVSLKPRRSLCDCPTCERARQVAAGRAAPTAQSRPHYGPPKPYRIY